MTEYLITAHYLTKAGNHNSTRLTLMAPDDVRALDLARQRITTDRRYRYAGKLDMDCVPA